VQYTRCAVTDQPAVSFYKTPAADGIKSAIGDETMEKVFTMRFFFVSTKQKNCLREWTGRSKPQYSDRDVAETNSEGFAWLERPMTTKPCAGVRLNLY
jgi:hypothetical protein